MAEAVEQALTEQASPDRRSRHGHRQDAGVSAAGDPLRQARHHLDRHEDAAGAALPQRPAVPAGAPGRVARLLHEGPRQLSLPQEALRPHRPAGAERTGRDQPVPHHQRLGEDDRDRRSRRTGGPARDQPAVAQARRAHRPLHRRGVPAVRPLLHHRDAAARGRERHHHRQPSPVLRRPGDQSGGGSRARCRRAARSAALWCSTRRTSWKTWPPTTSACRCRTCESTTCCAMWSRRCGGPTFPLAAGTRSVSASARAVAVVLLAPAAGRRTLCL